MGGQWSSQAPSGLQSQYYERGEGKEKIGILSFEVSNLASRLCSLWLVVQSAQLDRVHREVLGSEGVLKLICTDREIKLQLLEKELLDDLKRASVAVARMAKRCTDPAVQRVEEKLSELHAHGKPQHDILSPADMENEVFILEGMIAATGQLYRELETRDAFVASLDGMLEQELEDPGKLKLPIKRMQDKVAEQTQHVKVLKESSFWNKKLDGIVRLFADMICVVHDHTVSSLAAVTPASTPSPHSVSPSPSFKPGNTLGDSGLSLHYANLIILLERFSDQPRRVSELSRSQAYGMLPESLRMALRTRLQQESRDPEKGQNGEKKLTVDEWDTRVEGILKWLAPMAHATVRRQAERNFEAQLGSRSPTLLIETLFMADREKTEAVILELLVGLTFVVRRERELEAEEMEQTMKALLATAPIDSGPIDGG